MELKYFFKLLLIFILTVKSGYGQELRQDKNSIGVELLKPLYLLPGALAESSYNGAGGYTGEIAYKRALALMVYYRGTIGYTYFKKDSLRNTNTQYFSRGWYTKHGFDFVVNPNANHVHFVTGLSPFFTQYEEKGRGIFQGYYFENYNSPFDVSTQTMTGMELLLRLWIKTKSLVSFEITNRFSFPLFYTSSLYRHHYIPGIGHPLRTNDGELLVFSEGIEFKVFFSF